jgi:DNA topoisomerase-2
MCTILGLQFDKTYETKAERQELRYGHVMLMTDQDADGSHIKGLIMNLFRYYWPALLRPPIDDNEGQPFLSMFITPLLKASKKGKKKETHSFFSMAEYYAWRVTLQDDEVGKWSIKYYKGLGTSTPAEAKEYFVSFLQHYRPFRWESELKDGERLDMAFKKECADDRKDWILNVYDKNSQLNLDENNSVTFGDFVDNELIHFSHANNIRSLPSIVDGLKPSQRKVLFACFKRNLKDEIKVAQLAGYCAEHTAYHHGEASLHATIIGMAQDFCGSNNINLLIPSGQFGTRLEGGKDCASPRYVFTHLSPIARLLFPVEDDMLLEYREEDGQTIEPEFYCPIIPLLLVNGCQGIGTGWSTFIPQHNPMDVLNYIRAKLDESEPTPIEPYVRGFDGMITVDSSSGSYVTEGIISSPTKSSVTISELPVGVWTNDYKTRLVSMLKKGEIQSFTQDHTTTKVCFDIKVNTAKLNRLVKSDTLIKQFNLRNTLSTRNMHAFTPDMRIARFKTPQDIADAYFPVRLRLYSDRKSVLESNMKYSASVLKNKSRFIRAVSEDKINLLHGRKSKDATTALLDEMGFSKQSDLDAIKMDNDVVKRRSVSSVNNNIESSEDEDGTHNISKEYGYLLNLPLSSLTSGKSSHVASRNLSSDN